MNGLLYSNPVAMRKGYACQVRTVSQEGGYLFFKSSGLLFPRLTKQHPLIRLSHAMRLRIFFTKLIEVSPDVESWLQSARAWSLQHESWRSLQQAERHLVHASRRSLVAARAALSGLKTVYASPIARTEASNG
jgi:hypothetical protein